ncbi:hypothetical protein M3Y97_00310100 [Aphelenchoides bicaudatus]|nr:hypothetical protein M3Y97_00310100 [Aphelenchoides bicaudatus]
MFKNIMEMFSWEKFSNLLPDLWSPDEEAAKEALSNPEYPPLLGDKDKPLGGEMSSVDGNFFVCAACQPGFIAEQISFMQLDGVEMQKYVFPDFQEECHISQMTMIDSFHFLTIERKSSRLILFKLDVNAQTVSTLHSIDIGDFGSAKLLVDGKSPRKFVLLVDNPSTLQPEVIPEEIRSSTVSAGGRYQTGEIVERELKLVGEPRPFEVIGKVYFPKFHMQTIYFFKLSWNESLQMTSCRFNIEDSKKEEKATPMIVDNKFKIQDIQFDCFCWCDEYLYVISKRSNGHYEILQLNNETSTWLETRVRLMFWPISIHITKNAHLLVQTENIRQTAAELQHFTLNSNKIRIFC